MKSRLCLAYVCHTYLPSFLQKLWRSRKWERPKITALGHSSSYCIWGFKINLFEQVQEAVWESLMVLRQTILPFSHQRKLFLNCMKMKRSDVIRKFFSHTDGLQKGRCHMNNAAWPLKPPGKGISSKWKILAKCTLSCFPSLKLDICV